MKTKIFLFSFIFLFLSCAGEKSKQLNSLRSVKTGETKEQISKFFPAPDEIQHLTKTTEIIWGPEEEFWDEIPPGTDLEIWIYQQKDSLTKLYFLNDDNHLTYKITSPKDVVYEPTD